MGGLEWCPCCRLKPGEVPGDGYINVRNMLST